MRGAELVPAGGVRFTVWAPKARTVSVRLADEGRDVPMERRAGDVFEALIPEAGSGTRYFFLLDGERPRPDPRSRFQPDGVHGPSQVVDAGAHVWRHRAPARPLEEYVIYELHPGAFTPEGTWRAAAARLAHIVELGATAVELMPVAAFAGARNWGYDGVHPFAPVAAYGAPDDLRAFVDDAHGLGLSVIMDVVYNHLGPEGNYAGEYAPYVTDRHATPWGGALDYARREVRDWAIDNALMWTGEYRVDALRLDAIHAIVDDSPTHVLAELCRRVRPAILIAETDLNDVKVFEWGFDASWSDDFHHALHAALTGERDGYYKDFGGAETLARAIEDGWIRGPHPRRSRELAAAKLVIAAQNHDQIGNRARGERLEHLAGPEAARLAAVAMLAAAPAVPLLFMGEEWGTRRPFLYFTSHGDEALGRAVAEGRKQEFASFAWRGEVPDPQAEATFAASKLDWAERDRPEHAARLALYRDLLALRRGQSMLGARGKAETRARVEGDVVIVERGPDLRVILNLGERPFRVDGRWIPLLHSEDAKYGGSLPIVGAVVPPRGAAIYGKLQ